MQHLLDAFLSVSTGLDLDTTLRRIVEAAAELVDARYGALGVLREDGDGLAAFIHVGIDDELAAAHGLAARGQGGARPADHRALPAADRRPGPAPRPRSASRRTTRRCAASSASRCWSAGEVFGNLYMTEKRHGEFTAEDEAVLTALAGAAGIAIDNARLYEEGEVRRRWLAAVSDVRAALLDAASADEALRLIAERVATLTDADAAWLLTGPDPADGGYTVDRAERRGPGRPGRHRGSRRPTARCSRPSTAADARGRRST